MNAQRIEDLVRAWLATEDLHAEPPAGMRARAANARAEVAGRDVAGGRRWAPLRPIALVAVAMTLVLAAVLGVTLFGVLPIGRADCSGVTIERVRAAVSDVPGYRWHMTGSELMSQPTFHLEASPPTVDFDYTTAPLEFSGAYQAPAAWRIDEIQGYDERLVTQPHVASLITPEWDAVIFVDGQTWMRPRGSLHFRPETESNVPELREANQLYGLLFGLPFRMLPPNDAPAEAPLAWSTTSEGSGCRLTASWPTYGQGADGSAGLPDANWKLEVDVDPDTLLPTSARYAESSGEMPLASGAFSARTDIELSFRYDYEDPPVITSPVPAGFQPVDPQRAIADAQAFGVGDAPTVDQYQLGAAQAFLLHGAPATAALVYVDGRLQESASVQSDLDVWVTLLASGEPDPATFLVAVINDPRVASLEVRFTSGAQRTISGSGVNARSVTSGEGLGEIETWIAYDNAGNEVSVDPSP